MLGIFEDRGVNLTYIESKPSKGTDPNFDFEVSFDGKSVQGLDDLIRELNAQALTVDSQPPLEVPWFPTRIQDIDKFSTKTLDAGEDLEADHPGFSDAVYRERRKLIVHNALTYRHGTPIPRVEYTDEEVETWATVWNKLRAQTDKYAVKQYKEIMPLLERNCGYGERSIPQLEDISQFLQGCTGFSLRPVSGLLSARDFLNALAFRVFFSTQYIRHHTKPLYTPEPDICHELLGHVPLFADPDFAEFSQEIGLASLGASDDEIKKLATCYWFSVEFGLCNENGEKKAYGAGLLSSFGELEYACSPTRPAGGTDDVPEYRPWVPADVAGTDYPITTYQPVYFVAEDFDDVKVRMRRYCENLRKGFNAKYDPFTQSVKVDRPLKRVRTATDE